MDANQISVDEKVHSDVINLLNDTQSYHVNLDWAKNIYRWLVRCIGEI